MRTQTEINKQIEELASKHMENPKTEAVINTLAWVLGDEISPVELLAGE
jgi:hypothetical protein